MWLRLHLWGGTPALQATSEGPSVQVGIGLFTKSTAEYTKRQDNFMKEIDFVAANVIMALVADFCLVFLPAPTLSFACAPVPAPCWISVLRASLLMPPRAVGGSRKAGCLVT